MPKRSKKYNESLTKFDASKAYSFEEAAGILQKINYVKFNPSVDIAVRLGVDPRQANQMVRGVASLPHGIGKEVKVLVLTGPENEQAARNAGAEHVGLDDYINKIQNEGWTAIDVIICTPDVMPKVGWLGKILGFRGLMPNPKSGMVMMDVFTSVKEVKAGKIDFRVDRTGIIHTSIGKLAFSNVELAENAAELMRVLVSLKPTGIKDTYIQTVHLSSTMSPSIKIDRATLAGI